MATEILCKFYKFGHCKFSEKCHQMHVHDVCVNTTCEIATCSKRHPRPCKFYQRFRRCKFDPCSYAHEDTFEISEIKRLNTLLENKSKDLESLTLKTDQLESIINKLRSEISALSTHISSSLLSNPSLKANEDCLEFNHCNDDPRSQLPIQQRVKEVEENNVVLLGAVDDLENAVHRIQVTMSKQVPVEPSYVCKICRKYFPTEPLWRKHMKEEHKT